MELIRQRYPINVILRMMQKQYHMSPKGAKVAVTKVYKRMSRSLNPRMIVMRTMEYLQSIIEDIRGARSTEDWRAVTDLERLYGEVLGVLRPGFAGILVQAIQKDGTMLDSPEGASGVLGQSPAAQMTFQLLLEQKKNPIRVLEPEKVSVTGEPNGRDPVTERVG